MTRSRRGGTGVIRATVRGGDPSACGRTASRSRSRWRVPAPRSARWRDRAGDRRTRHARASCTDGPTTRRSVTTSGTNAISLSTTHQCLATPHGVPRPSTIPVSARHRRQRDRQPQRCLDRAVAARGRRRRRRCPEPGPGGTAPCRRHRTSRPTRARGRSSSPAPTAAAQVEPASPGAGPAGTGVRSEGGGHASMVCSRDDRVVVLTWASRVPQVRYDAGSGTPGSGTPGSGTAVAERPAQRPRSPRRPSAPTATARSSWRGGATRRRHRSTPPRGRRRSPVPRASRHSRSAMKPPTVSTAPPSGRMRVFRAT